MKNTLIYFELVTTGSWFTFNFDFFLNLSGWSDLFLFAAVSKRTNCSPCWLGSAQTLWVGLFLWPMKVEDRKENLMEPGSSISATPLVLVLLLLHGQQGTSFTCCCLSLPDNNHLWTAPAPSWLQGFLSDVLELGQFVLKSSGARGWHGRELMDHAQ